VANQREQADTGEPQRWSIEEQKSSGEIFGKERGKETPSPKR
jgi:hypothetical protein